VDATCLPKSLIFSPGYSGSAVTGRSLAADAHGARLAVLTGPATLCAFTRLCTVRL